MTPSVQPRLRGVLIAVLAVAPTFLVVALALADAPSSGPEIRAQLSPRRYTTLSAEVAARVLRLPVHEGERFRSGQRLVELRPPRQLRGESPGGVRIRRSAPGACQDKKHHPRLGVARQRHRLG